MGPLLNGAADPVTKDMEQGEELNGFFVLVFTGKMCIEESEASRTSGEFWSNEDSSLTEDSQVREHTNWTWTNP